MIYTATGFQVSRQKLSWNCLELKQKARIRLTTTANLEQTADPGVGMGRDLYPDRHSTPYPRHQYREGETRSGIYQNTDLTGIPLVFMVKDSNGTPTVPRHHPQGLLWRLTDITENSVATLGRQLGYPGLLGRHLNWINRINLCRELYSLA